MATTITWTPNGGALAGERAPIQIDVHDAAGIKNVMVAVWNQIQYHGNADRTLLLAYSAQTLFDPYADLSTSNPTGTDEQVILVPAVTWPDVSFEVHVEVISNAGVITISDKAFTCASADIAGPTMTNRVPAIGSTISSTTDVQFDVIDPTGVSGGRGSKIDAVFSTGAIETIMDSDGVLHAPYLDSTFNGLVNGYTIFIHRTGGWIDDTSVTIVVATLDGAKNDATLEYQFKVANDPPDTSQPLVGNFSPSVGTEIGRMDPLFFDVTDDSGDFRRVLVAVAFADGVELAHDGDDFTVRYAVLSERIPIDVAAIVTGSAAAPFALADGQTLTIEIDGGGPQTITFHTADFDDIAAAQTAEVCAAIATGLAFGTSVPSEDGTHVVVRTNSGGITSSLTVTGGTAAGALGLSSDTAHGTAGWHFRLRRTDGWPSAPSVAAYAFDKSGNESA